MSSKLSFVNKPSQTTIKILTNKLTTSITNITKRLNYLTLSLTISLTSILPILLPATANATPSTPPDSCFDFNSGTGTITDYYDYEGNNNSNPACTREVIIPNIISGTSVTTIGSSAFQSNQLTSVTIPSTITSIGNTAFHDNQLTSVTIPNSVTSIGNYAFYTNQLSSVTIPNTVTTIGDGVFQQNQLTSLTIPDSVTSIGVYAFRNNQLNSLNLSSNVTTIGNWAFGNNQLTNVVIPNQVTTIGKGAFEHNQLTNLTIPDSVTTIDEFAFYDNNLTNMTIGSSVSVIGNNAFNTNNLASIYIPTSVTSLGAQFLSGQTIPGGTSFTDFMLSGYNPQVGQAYLDSVIYVNIFMDETQAGNLGLTDFAFSELAFGNDINADGDQTDLLSGQLINPAHITSTYKDTEGNTIAPSTTATGTGLTTYLAVDNQTNDLSLYYKAGNSYTVPTAPSIAGYTITTTPEDIASLSAGDNQINYVYTANSNNNNNSGGGNNSSNTIDLTTPTSPISNFSLKPVSLTTPTGTTINSSSTVPESSLAVQDNNNQYPLGLVNFSFTTNQSSNQVVLNFETDLKPNQVTARKYNSNTNTYNNLPTSANPTITETTINNKHHLTLSYTLIDNGELDLDPTTGIIKDPVGLAVSNQTYNQLANTGTNNTLPIATAISMVTIASGIWVLSKRKKSYSSLG